MSGMQILTQMQTSVAVAEISESQDHFQCNVQPNADGLSRWRKIILLQQKHQLEGLYEPPKYVSLKLFAQNQTL